MLPQLFNNYILQFLIILSICFYYFLYKKHLKYKKLLIQNKDDINEKTFQLLDKYRIKKVYPSIAKILLYFSLNIVLLFILRYSRLGTYINIIVVNPYTTFHGPTILVIILTGFCLLYYLKMMRELAFIEIARLYFYYYHPKYKFYDFVDNRFFGRFLLKNILVRFGMFLKKIPQLSKQKNINGISPIKFAITLSTNIQKLLEYMICYIICYTNVLVHQTPRMCFILVFLYDITLNQIYYTYYALLFYSITSLLSNINQFFGNVSPGECSLHEYFYEGLYVRTISAEEYKILNEKVETGYKLNNEELTLIRMRAKQIEMLPFVPEWIEFIANDLQNQFARKNGDKNTHKIYTLPIRRVWLLFGLCIGTVYTLYYNQIVITCGKIILNNNILTFVILFITWFLWYNTGYRQKKDINGKNTFIVEPYGNKLYHRLFYFITCFSIIFNTIIFLHYNFPAIMMDFLIDNSWLKIQLKYTLENKLKYFMVYFDSFIKTSIIIPENLSYHKALIFQTNIKEYINITTTVKELKILVSHMAAATIILDDLYFTLFKQIIMEHFQEQYFKMLEEKYIMITYLKNIIITFIMGKVLIDVILIFQLWLSKEALLTQATAVLIDIIYAVTHEIASEIQARRFAQSFLRTQGFIAFSNALKKYVPKDIGIE